MPLVTYVPQPTFAGLRFVPPMVDMLDTLSIPLRYSHYRLIEENFAKKVKAQNKLKRQVSVWEKKFKPFVMT